MRENTLRNAPLDGLSITLTWSIPENPPSQGPEDFFSNYQLRFKDSQPDSSIICIVKNDGWSTGDYPYSYQLQNEREGISFDLDVDRFRIDMTKPDNYSNWDSFAPVIESGIDILLQALNKTVVPRASIRFPSGMTTGSRRKSQEGIPPISSGTFLVFPSPFPTGLTKDSLPKVMNRSRHTSIGISPAADWTRPSRWRT